MARRKNVIAPNDEKSLVAMDKMAAEIEKARELYGDGQPFDEERVLDCLVFRAERTTEELLQFGRYCLWLKAEVGHGRFLEGLKRRNLNITAANWSMLIYEKLGANSAALQNLGPSKARYLTFFSKEEIDTYAKGGPLGDIPHDDVANMTTRELEAEVRKLRKANESQKNRDKEKIEKLDDEIERLQSVIDCRTLTEKEKAEKAIEAKLEELRKKLFTSIQLARFYFDDAVNIITTARQLKGVTFPMLEKWAKSEYEEIAGFNELFEQLDDELNYISVDKGDGKRE
jgi:hypothetical protein